MSETKTYLHIQCGEPSPRKLHRMFQDGHWNGLRLDHKKFKPDFVGSLTDMSAVPNNHVDAVWFSHLLQTLPDSSHDKVMKEVKRILKPNGLLLTVVTDLYIAAHHIQAGNLSAIVGPNKLTAIETVYGRVHEYKSGFTTQSLGNLLRKHDFMDVRLSRETVNIWVGGTFEPSTLTETSDKLTVNDHHKDPKLRLQPAQDALPDYLDQPPNQWNAPDLSTSAA